MNLEAEPFTPAQRTAIVAEWKRIAAEPAPASPRPYGCLAVIAGLVLFFVLPQLGIHLSPPWNTVLLAAIGLLVAVGLFTGVFMGSGRYGRAVTRAEAALQALSGDTAIDEAIRLRLAVDLIANAWVSDGPTLSAAIDFAEARRRLGANLDYVVAVEQVLAQEIGDQHVFIQPGA
ncbi:MAG: hypothetical protein KF771_00615 [Burkholderiales bacterium]|nr:hypothetical protein [Burkholderiales bacterium]